MKRSFLLLCTALTLASAISCTEANGDEAADATEKTDKKKKKKGNDESLENSLIAEAVPGLRSVGSLGGVPESSGLAPGEQAGTYYSFGDNGNSPILYRINETGKVLDEISIGAKNDDWESLTRDNKGYYYIGDCGNNQSDRRNLRFFRVKPASPQQVDKISFSYPDQTEFPPKKKQRHFDCEASVWHDGQLWLFTKDQQEQSSYVYTVPDQPGTHTAKRISTINIPSQVTDAALSPNGQRLILLGRGELFILDGSSWNDILKASPRRVNLAGTGQTEGVAFKDEKTLLISTEQGGLYEYALQ
ncbi:hypothetical protein GCM10023185_15830 [Hymenobacter saemangeumensis]|uniref:WD40 repeat domain-containing protein n=1 Tax=Hymenobacter saemangeumensis TaxID=1084522 RepID=A0ABP8I9H5_9BACT